MLRICNVAGLYVLASESVKIPWFDSVFADIGDEQSLSQSLSTFSGHLKQISVRNNVLIVYNLNAEDPFVLLFNFCYCLKTFQFSFISKF